MLKKGGAIDLEEAQCTTETASVYQLRQGRVSMKIVFALILLGVLTSTAHALQWCRLDILDTGGAVIKTTTASRGEDFGDKTVRKLKDCDVCWSEGKKLGPQSGYCGYNNGAGDEYKITCMKNSGTIKTKEYNCP
jgi:hypothetical protein